MYEKVDDNTFQEVLVEKEGKMIFRGPRYVFCSGPNGCKRWVAEPDYEKYCSYGWHEYAEEIKSPLKDELDNADDSQQSDVRNEL